MFNEWNIRVAHFLGALKFHILDTRQESSYGQKLEEISAAIVSVNPSKSEINTFGNSSYYIIALFRFNIEPLFHFNTKTKKKKSFQENVKEIIKYAYEKEILR